MSNQILNSNVKKYDLIERTAVFGENVIEFCKTINRNTITNPLISQLIRSATSVGANYMEADGAESKKDFNHKIGISKKKSKETMHWLRMISKADNSNINICRRLWQEAHELTLIFSAIMRSNKNK